MARKKQEGGLARWLPLGRAPHGAPAPGSRPGSSFRTRWIDVERGIRVGHLEEHERITWILKQRLGERYNDRFIIDRWGRGVYWQYIWFVPERNWKAKSIGGPGHFASAKYFIAVDQDRRIFQAGLFIESGHQRDNDPRHVRTREWDWHRFMRHLARDKAFRTTLTRLIRKDGFEARVGFGKEVTLFDAARMKRIGQVLGAIRRKAPGDWTVVSVYYPMDEKELAATPGPALIDALLTVFDELAPLLNACLKIPLVLDECRPATVRPRPELF